MSINARLKQGIRSRLAGSVEPAFSDETETSELYEEYIFNIILNKFEYFFYIPQTL